ncbi:MAG TPA: SPOR domain-containing protein [Saprospiraceae bacterium]|nr:SPOR domain-containing protein [Saprospiraceae bacterium]HPI06119.1 SPOR domain-containing protein [Saprospiraceae bacterium]
MKTNNLLTYLLYALLGLLIIAAGYKACQMQESKKRQAEEEAELQKTLRDMGYVQDDTTATGSSYAGDTTTSTVVTSSGIEKEPATSTTPTTSSRSTAATPTTKTTTPKPVTTTPAASTASTVKSATSTASTMASKGVAAVKGPGTGRWAVRAGTFSQMEGARRRLEEVIRLGYPNAEISKTSDGKAAVVVFRSNDKNAAIRVVDKLEEKNIDAAVFDRNKKN